MHALPWPILKVKVNVMHISTVNISPMVTYRISVATTNNISTVNIAPMVTYGISIATTNKYEVTCDLSVGIFTHDLGQFYR